MHASTEAFSVSAVGAATDSVPLLMKQPLTARVALAVTLSRPKFSTAFPAPNKSMVSDTGE